MGRMGSRVPYRHGQDGQSGAISPWAGWAVRCHIAMGRMGSPVPYRHGQDGQSGAISPWAGWAVRCHIAMSRTDSSGSPGSLRPSWLAQAVLGDGYDLLESLPREMPREKSMRRRDCFMLDTKSLLYAKATVSYSMRKACSMRKTWL